MLDIMWMVFTKIPNENSTLSDFVTSVNFIRLALFTLDISKEFERIQEALQR